MRGKNQIYHNSTTVSTILAWNSVRLWAQGQKWQLDTCRAWLLPSSPRTSARWRRDLRDTSPPTWRVCHDATRWGCLTKLLPKPFTNKKSLQLRLLAQRCHVCFFLHLFKITSTRPQRKSFFFLQCCGFLFSQQCSTKNTQSCNILPLMKRET